MKHEQAPKLCELLFSRCTPPKNIKSCLAHSIPTSLCPCTTFSPFMTDDRNDPTNVTAGKRRWFRKPDWGRLTVYGILAVVALGLFFGLFFGLNFPEIVRHGWPITKCTVTSTNLNTRYCCFTECRSLCGNEAFGAPTCSSLVNQINGGTAGYNPAECQRNSSACPNSRGDLVCDNGYYCCSRCCDTCQKCSKTCTGSGNSQSCTQSCSSYQCNCRCCSSTQHRSCTVQCPTCFYVALGMTYTPYGGSARNVSISQDFKQNQGDAQEFADEHAVGTTHKCFYNRKNLDEVSLDVSFTGWKWAITAIFGMVPVLAVILYGGYALCCRSIIDRVRGQRGSVNYRSKGKTRAVGDEPGEGATDVTHTDVKKVEGDRSEDEPGYGFSKDKEGSGSGDKREEAEAPPPRYEEVS
ncbi:hypothetical protein PM082_015795 [Marasmius tenuissimus]|nr:hypothetical protein PM082_015795 [Marasmius tenuissimus]